VEGRVENMEKIVENQSTTTTRIFILGLKLMLEKLLEL